MALLDNNDNPNISSKRFDTERREVENLSIHTKRSYQLGKKDHNHLKTKMSIFKR